jgi:calcineurin-like phosphoesterase family protein
MIFFTADTHFFHNNIIRSCERPFKTLVEMHDSMIQKWNSCVADRDEIYILGDFAYKAAGKEVNSILSRLKGKKYLVRGNHERYLADSAFDPKAFEWVKDYYSFIHQGRKIVLFHYPILEWEGAFHRSLMLYGHIHNRGEKEPDYGEKFKLLGPRAINVGVDVNDFYPVCIDRILTL